MKTRTTTFLFLLIFQLSLAQQKDVKYLSKEFDKVLSGHFKSTEPGATVLVSRNGKIIYKKAFGMANLELNSSMQVANVFRIGSITKQFTAVAILQLVEEGKLSLADEITKFFPDYPVQNSKITIEHLLTHTSGIRDYSSMRDTVQRGKLDVSPKEMIDYFKGQPLRFLPGSKYEYSNSGYFLLGSIIEKLTGKTYAQYLEDKIFRPLGMMNSFYSSETKVIKNRASGYSKKGNEFENAPYLSMTQPYAAGSILSTVEDIFKWQQGVQSFKLVSKQLMEKAWTRYELNDGAKSNYGYGWRMGYIQESPSLWHGGLVNGFKGMAIYLAKEDIFVVVLTNCENYFPEDIIATLAAIAIGDPYQRKEIKLGRDMLKRFSGVYENEKGLQRIIRLEDDRLYSQLNRSPGLPIKAFSQNEFFLDPDPMQSIEFTLNGNGDVEKLIFKSRTAIESWKRTNKPMPAENGIKLDQKILEGYTGVYEIAPEVTVSVTSMEQRLFLQLTGQDKLEAFAESENKFFLKVNDAVLEFVRDNDEKIVKVVITQGGRRTEAKKIK